MKTLRSPSVFSTRRRTIAIRSFEPGGGRSRKNFSHSAAGARSAKDQDAITKGPRVTEAMRPSTIAINQAASPTSSRNVVVKYRPRRTSAASALTRSFSVSITDSPPRSFRPRGAGRRCRHDQGNERGVNQPASKPGADQHHVGEAGRDQADGQRQVDAFASAHFPKSALHRRNTFSR